MNRAPRLLLVLPLLLLAAGCRNGGATADATLPAGNANLVSTEPIKAVPDKDRYKVKADTTGFFRYSPLQASGSDQDLKKNDRLTMVKPGRGFSQVRTVNDQVGYVGTEDIVPLSAAEIAQEDAATIQAAEAAAGVGVAGLPLAAAGTGTSPSSGGIAKKPQNSAPAITIPSDAGRNERLPEADARPTASPGVNFR